MKPKKVSGAMVGVDLGGTNVRAGLVKNGKLAQVYGLPIRAKGSKQEVLDDLYAAIDAVIDSKTKSIGVGVPSLVIRETGTLLDTVNIPSWKKVPLRKLLEKRYSLPVRLDNDANCFALGELHFGEGRGCADFVGLVLGTGLGAGIIARGRLVSGTDCGAGEFGTIPYLDGIVENYASGQFFRRFGREGKELALACGEGDAEAARIFGEFAVHAAFAIKVILYSLAPPRIILGGSVGGAYTHYRVALQDALRDFAYPSVLKSLSIKVSKLRHGAILGAASLFADENTE